MQKQFSSNCLTQSVSHLTLENIKERDKKNKELTYGTLRQPSQGINIIPPRLIIPHIDLTIIIHVADNPIQLQRSLNQTRQPQHKENKAADDDNPR